MNTAWRVVETACELVGLVLLYYAGGFKLYFGVALVALAVRMQCFRIFEMRKPK
jgi:hypothetical protein